jgi:MFS family permease
VTLSSLGPYRAVLGELAFRRFWLGFTFSVLGDSMTRVALTWHVYETARSAAALGWLTLCYTAPVAVSGFLAAALLDRFDRRTVMIGDCLIRGVVMAAIPVLHLTGRLALGHVYLAAAVWGALMMLTLAGTPALLPALVAPRHLGTANALETLSYTVVGVIGPPLAGLLAPRVGAPNLLLVDAVSYLVFAAALTAARSAHRPPGPEPGHPGPSLAGVARVLARHPVLVSTTLMFMAWNVGHGALQVWLPVAVDRRLGGGARLYGGLLGALAAGEIVSAFLAGGRVARRPLGTLICRAQGLSGLALVPVAAAPTVAVGVLGLALFGAASAPLTIWAQTLRMQIIPEDMRGRAFALLRTIMQAGAPLGGLAAGWLLPRADLRLVILLSATLAGLPGVLGTRVRALREAGVPDGPPVSGGRGPGAPPVPSAPPR